MIQFLILVAVKVQQCTLQQVAEKQEELQPILAVQEDQAEEDREVQEDQEQDLKEQETHLHLVPHKETQAQPTQAAQAAAEVQADQHREHQQDQELLLHYFQDKL
tara:strand:+ start:337 stop:651 length:315 start_codon:yes stop_codon:yes gene_type:complete